MSDNLKGGLDLQSFIFTDGGLPESVVFNNIFNSVQRGFNLLKGIIGPAIRAESDIDKTTYVVSSNTYNSLFSGSLESRKAIFKNLAEKAVINTFNLARIIGPHGVLNPIYLPGTTHPVVEQSSGWPLRTDTFEQQLPFPAISGGTMTISNTPEVAWTRVYSKTNLYSTEGGGYRFYYDTQSQTLYSSSNFDNGESIKYDLYIPNTESYLGAGYNVIPDFSLLSLPEMSRPNAGAGDFGACKITYISSSITGDTSRWKIELPKVISAKESILNYGDATNPRKIINSSFEPVGRYHAGTASKRYCLRGPIATDMYNNEPYAGDFLDENLAVLYDYNSQTTYQVALEKDNLSSNWHIFYFNLPYAAINTMMNNDGSKLSDNISTYNTKHFFLFLLQTNLSESVVQIGSNFARHTHDGRDSKKLSHKNLMHTSSEYPVLGGETNGISQQGELEIFGRFRNFVTDFVPPNDVHPQYLTKYGYMYGGSAGLYYKNPPPHVETRNMFHGDFVFAPLNSAQVNYLYASAGEASSKGPERIDWTLSSQPDEWRRSHSLIFGIPQVSQATEIGNVTYRNREPVTYVGPGSGLVIDVSIPVNTFPAAYNIYHVDIVSGGLGYNSTSRVKVSGVQLGGLDYYNDLELTVTSAPSGIVAGLSVTSNPAGKKFSFHHDNEFSNTNGATRLYYEPLVVYNSGLYDQTENIWSLKRHGFIPGNETNGNLNAFNNETSTYAGLNITWGNLFFGYREDIFNGRLKSGYETPASAYWRTSEFNIITTAGGKSGLNTNSPLNNNYTYRDGFVARALEGSNIWLSAGGEPGTAGESPVPGTVQNAVSESGKPGVIAIEASTYPTYNPGYPYGIKGQTWGQDIYSSGAGIFAAPSLTNAGKIPWAVDTLTYTFPDKSPYVYANLWDTNTINSNPLLKEGGLLDIYAIAPDRNRYVVDNLTAVEDVTLTLSMKDVAIGTDKSLKGWVQGRPFIRGTYGINFCLAGTLNNLSDDFQTGYHLKLEGEDWGPGSAVLAVTGNEYIHREYRFWGKNTETSVSPSLDGFQNTVGGNLNLLYNFGRNYRRFGLNKAWSNNNLHGNTTTSIWSNSRSIALGSSKPENYGSAIRGASFVDAFVGVRNDPHHPYIGTYVFPFSIELNSGMYISNPANLSFGTPGSMGDVDDNYNPLKTTYLDPQFTNGADIMDAITNEISFDSLMRGLEQIVKENSGPNAKLRYVASVQLRHAKYVKEADSGTWADFYSTGNSSFTWSGGTIGYNCYVNTATEPLDSGRLAYLAKFPLTDQTSTRNWALKFTFEGPPDQGLDWWTKELPFLTPFRWSVHDGALWMEVQGNIVINVITAYQSQ